MKDILTRSVGERMLWLGTTYPVAVAFKENILLKSRRGAEFVEHYYPAVPFLFETARRDPSLAAESLQAWFVVFPFVEACVRETGVQDAAFSHTAVAPIFTRAMHDQCVAVLERFEGQLSDRNAVQLVHMVRLELVRCVGLSPTEALAVLHQGPPAEPHARREGS